MDLQTSIRERGTLQFEGFFTKLFKRKPSLVLSNEAEFALQEYLRARDALMLAQKKFDNVSNEHNEVVRAISELRATELLCENARQHLSMYNIPDVILLERNRTHQRPCS